MTPLLNPKNSHPLGPRAQNTGDPVKMDATNISLPVFTIRSDDPENSTAIQTSPPDTPQEHALQKFLSHSAPRTQR